MRNSGYPQVAGCGSSAVGFRSGFGGSSGRGRPWAVYARGSLARLAPAAPLVVPAHPPHRQKARQSLAPATASAAIAAAAVLACTSARCRDIRTLSGTEARERRRPYRSSRNCDAFAVWQGELQAPDCHAVAGARATNTAICTGIF